MPAADSEDRLSGFHKPVKDHELKAVQLSVHLQTAGDFLPVPFRINIISAGHNQTVKFIDLDIITDGIGISSQVLYRINIVFNLFSRRGDGDSDLSRHKLRSIL